MEGAKAAKAWVIDRFRFLEAIEAAEGRRALPLGRPAKTSTSSGPLKPALEGTMFTIPFMSLRALL